MGRKLIIDGNAVYEIDEDCMVRRNLSMDAETEKSVKQQEKRETHTNKTEK